jgi:hypothetical protein
MIALHVGETITLIQPMAEVEAGDLITLYPGCLRSFQICKNKFHNEVNYLGFEWIPTKNPFKEPFY